MEKRPTKRPPKSVLERLREMAIARDHCCQTCGSTENLHVHHRSYEHYGECNEAELNDVVVLCASCHSKVHGNQKKMHKAHKEKATKRKKENDVVRQERAKAAAIRKMLKSWGGVFKQRRSEGYM